MAYSEQTADFASIALSIQDRLSTQLSIDPTKCRLVASDTYSIVDLDDKFIFVRCFGPSPFTDAGAGRRATPITRRVRLYLYSRSSVDMAGDDTLALTDLSLGHFVFEESVYDALTNWFPRRLSEDDSPGDKITIEPLHPIDSSDGPPQRDPEDDNTGLIRSIIDFECKYLLKINVTAA